MSDRTLAEQLGDLPASVAALPDANKQDLANALQEARRRQAAALSKAGEESLRFVPALLRPAIRRAVRM